MEKVEFKVNLEIQACGSKWCKREKFLRGKTIKSPREKELFVYFGFIL